MSSENSPDKENESGAKKLFRKIMSVNKETVLSHSLAMLIGGIGAIALYKSFIMSAETEDNKVKVENADTPKKTARIWIDGCFDLMHFGHANAFRQARSLGDYLIVGLNGDEEIIRIKGPPIMLEEERYVAVKACRWVDEVVKNCPYSMNREYLEMVFDKFEVDYVVHGDDPCILPDGTDVFQDAKDMGKFMTIKRTEGVSTTEIVGRMLMISNSHHTPRPSASRLASRNSVSINESVEIHLSPSKNQRTLGKDTKIKRKAFSRTTDFLPTGRRVQQFGSNKSPQKGDKIVYIDGAWDLFHAGHIELLEKAKKFGDFLLVGIHDDDLVNQSMGSNYPILNLHERSLGTMSCRYVDEVIIGAPKIITQQLLTTFNISVVCTYDSKDDESTGGRLKIPKEKGILRKIDIARELTTQLIVKRVFERKDAFTLKYTKKYAQEEEYKKKPGIRTGKVS